MFLTLDELFCKTDPLAGTLDGDVCHPAVQSKQCRAFRDMLSFADEYCSDQSRARRGNVRARRRPPFRRWLRFHRPPSDHIRVQRGGDDGSNGDGHLRLGFGRRGLRGFAFARSDGG